MDRADAGAHPLSPTPALEAHGHFKTTLQSPKDTIPFADQPLYNYTISSYFSAFPLNYTPFYQINIPHRAEFHLSITTIHSSFAQFAVVQNKPIALLEDITRIHIAWIHIRPTEKEHISKEELLLRISYIWVAALSPFTMPCKSIHFLFCQYVSLHAASATIRRL